MGIKTFLAWQRLLTRRRIEAINARNRAQHEQRGVLP